jgi:rSAM/selenodomain-associated transferase 1
LRAATRPKLDARLIVFAKAPQPGRVKTRLAPALGAKGAARLHARLVRRALATAIAARCGPVELRCAPRVREPFFLECRARLGVALRAQGRGDLGERMHRALARALREHRSAVLIGSDCPALRPADLRRAARLLAQGADAVFAPARDGGYALVGLRRSSKALFERIEWGGPGVMRATRQRLRGLGWNWRELRTVWDVDRPEDLGRLRMSGLLARAARSALRPRPPS